MGLFGWKKEREKKPKAIGATYYDGDLPGLTCNYPCHILLTEDFFFITTNKPPVEVKLERSRILSMEYYDERPYMQRFRGHDGIISATGLTGFCIVNYIGKDGMKKRLDFWTGDTLKTIKMVNQFRKNQPEQSYEI